MRVVGVDPGLADCGYGVETRYVPSGDVPLNYRSAPWELPEVGRLVATIHPMEIPEQTRELADVTIRAREPRPGFFEVSFQPTSPDTHLARRGFSLDTAQGVRGHSLPEVLEWAELHWRQNYPT